MIGIRVDANEIVATGHIMRCMTIATQIKKLAEEVMFFVADEYGVSMLEEKNFPYTVLHTDWENPIQETELLLKEIKDKNIHTMLFDSYRMNKAYFEKLRGQLPGGIRMAYIDDLFEEVYPMDVLINYNAYHTEFAYADIYPKNTVLCLGPKYVPLREEFQKNSFSDGLEKSVLLSCGGGDSLQSLYGILEKAVLKEEFKDVLFHVVVGRYHQKRELLQNLVKENSNIILHDNVGNMAELMEQCKIAVSAAGTMLYELCATKRPTVFFITADNQKYDSSFFEKEERMLFAGDIREDRDNCINRILYGINRLLEDKKLCLGMKDKLYEVTDGKGALRIAEILINR